MADPMTTATVDPPAEAAGATSAQPTTKSGVAASAASVVLRIVCHAVAEVPLFVIAGIQISKGWIPTSDDAVIAWRTRSVFSGPLPLDGQFTQISAAGHHPAFDLGPMQYYLLAIPNRIDPVHGILWGSALVMAILVALSIEAAWSAAGAVGGTLIAAALALMTGTMVESSVNLAWNPSLGAYAFAATIATMLAVARGRSGWLPVAVATASLAAQSHISFVLPCIATLVVGLGLGIVEERRFPAGAFIAGLGVAVLCFLAPLVQEATGNPGNWSVVFGNLGHLHKTVGTSAALRGVGAASAIPPSWWVHVPVYTTLPEYKRLERSLYAHSAAWGVTSLALTIAVGIGAWFTRRRSIAALAGVSAASGIAAVVTLASVPDTQAPYLNYYLYFCLWPIGMGILVSWGAAVVSGGMALVRWRAPDGVPSRRPAVVLAGFLAAAIVLAAAGAALTLNDEGYGTSGLFLMGWQPIQTVNRLLPRVMALVHSHDGHPHRPVVVVYRTAIPYVNTDIEDSLAYELVVHGVPARVIDNADQPLGAPYAGSRRDPRVVIVPGYHGGFTLDWLPPVESRP